MNKTIQLRSGAGLRTAFLDRDGVLNRKMPEGKYVARWADFRMLPQVAEAIRILNEDGVRVVVVSNQRGIALGLYTSEDVIGIHKAFHDLLQTEGAHVDGFYFCPHDREDCHCRKPLSGMFDQAVADFPAIEARTSVMIGDSQSDIEFGKRLGMTTVFIEANDEERASQSKSASELADFVYPSLYECVCSLHISSQL